MLFKLCGGQEGSVKMLHGGGPQERSENINSCCMVSALKAFALHIHVIMSNLFL